MVQAGPDLALKQAQGAAKDGILSNARRIAFDADRATLRHKYICAPTTIATLAALTPEDDFDSARRGRHGKGDAQRRP
jgi:hypothetical protein